MKTDIHFSANQQKLIEYLGVSSPKTYEALFTDVSSDIPSSYNHLIGGRVGQLLSLFIIQDTFPHLDLKSNIQNVFQAFIQDATFLKNKLIWLQPYNVASERLLLGNSGIYLGLSIIQRFYASQKNLQTIINHISFEVELKTISSITIRRKLKQYLEGKMSFDETFLQELLVYHHRTQNIAVLEFVVCGVILGNHVFDKKLVKEIIHTLERVSPTIADFIRILIDFLGDSPKRQLNIEFTNNVVYEIFSRNFQSLYDFCGEEFIKTTTQNLEVNQTIEPSVWLKNIYKTYPNRTSLFRNIVWREQLRLKIPSQIFEPSNNTSYSQNIQALHVCYRSSSSEFFETKFKIDKNKFMMFFNSFWIGSLSVSSFKEWNNPKTISDFKKHHTYTKFTILLTKRFEKKITWQGRNFRDNDEVDFIYYFLEDYRSPNQYKKDMGSAALEDFKITEMIFWALELGIMKAHLSSID